MKIPTLVLIAVLLVAILGSSPESNLESDMARLGVHTALLVHSEAVDEYSLWSPDSLFLGINIMGKWLKLDTRSVRLREGTWHQQRIGVVEPKPRLQ